MNPDYNKIFNQSSCLTHSEMIEYVSGDLSIEGKRRIEFHIADCDMCNDELEGLSNMNNVNDLPLIVSKLNNEINSEINKNKFVLTTESTKRYNLKRILSVAASVALLITIGFIINDFADKNSDNLAQAEVHEESSMEEAELLQKEEMFDEIIESEEYKSAEESVNTEPNHTTIDLLEIVEDRIVSAEDLTFSDDEGNVVDADFDLNDSEEIVVATEERDEKITAIISNDLSVDKRKKELKKSDSEILAGVSEETTDASDKNFLGYTTRNVPSASKENRNKTGVNYLSMRNGGLLSYNIKSYKEAAEDFDNYLTYNPEDYEIVYKSGMSYFYLKKYSTAIVRFNTIIAGDINNYIEDAQWYKSMGLINQGKENEAVTLLNQIVFKNGKYQKRALDAINQLENK